MRAAVRLFLARLNPHALLMAALVLGALFGVLLLVQGTDYVAARRRRFHLRREQGQAETRHGQAVRTSSHRTKSFEIDSARRATERRHRLLSDSILATQDAQLTTSRPARVVLPECPRPGN